MGFLRRNAGSADGGRPGARERARMRRRLRRQRQMREALLLDLGALVFELNRHGRREPELLQAKAAELTAVDEEVRALADALGNEHTITQLVATGVAGSCENCGSLMSVDARYCSSCGAPAVPAMAGDERRGAFRAEGPAVDHAALGMGAEAGQQYAPPAWAQTAAQPGAEQAPTEEAAPREPTDEALAHEAAAEEEAWREASEDDVPAAGYAPGEEETPAEEEETPAEEDVPAEEPDEPAAEEDALAEEPDESAEEDAAAEEPDEPAVDEAAEREPVGEGVLRVTPMERTTEDAAESEPEPEPVAESEESAQPEAPSPTSQDGRQAQRPSEHPPRALADDALDTAAKAIRTGIARGREWIRGRRTGA